MRHTASDDQHDQATCSEGMAASSLAWEASAPTCHDPMAWVTATTSMNPAPTSIRGGARGYSQKTTNPTTLISTKVLRRGRYSLGYRHHSRATRARVTTKWAVS